MTTKILTLRVSTPIYSTLCKNAGEKGMPIAAYVRQLVERKNSTDQFDQMQKEILDRLDTVITHIRTKPAAGPELLLLCRGIAAHISPQLVAQVRAKLAQQ